MIGAKERVANIDDVSAVSRKFDSGEFDEPRFSQGSTVPCGLQRLGALEWRKRVASHYSR